VADADRDGPSANTKARHVNDALNLRLDGRISIVTGAARGIGYACAQALAAAGSDVALCDLDEGAAVAAAAKVAAETGVRTRGYALDVARPPAVHEGVARIAADFGAIDHLVNNAGVQFVAPIPDFPEADWDRVRAVDLDSVFYMTKAVWPHLVTRGRGRLVNVASAHGLVASPFKAAYIASKHGVVGFTKSSALEGAEIGITANAICPGAVFTELIAGQGKALAASFGGGISDEEALRRGFLERMPTGRFIDPLEVGALCAYLCSDPARSITGAAIAIDGGWTAQ
jgi:3-hydroxybutyrate dehydrogenase